MLTLTIESRKYYKPYDDSDNAGCWQVDAVGEDIDAILRGLGVDFQIVPEDWGTAYLWSGDGTEFWMQVECSDTASCRFRITLGASRKWLVVFSREVTHPESICPELVSRLRDLNERSDTE
jgi:hypothetical protein